MAGHYVIDAYLDKLEHQLPAEAVAELADGLDEAFRHHTNRGLEPASAAVTATAEFGHPEHVIEAFARQSAGHRTAVALLATGPLFAILWSTSLISAHAWTWSVPPATALGLGAALIVTVAGLVMAATSRSYRRTRIAAPACAAIVLLDAAVITVVGLAASALTLPMALAIPVSLARICFATRSVPRVLA